MNTAGEDDRKGGPKRFYTQEQLLDIQSKFSTIGGRADELLLKFLAHRFSNEQASEYAHQGFSRRIQTIGRCIENAFKIIPPGTSEVPSKERLRDAGINIQACVANVYGSVDNLAWIWVHERGLADRISRKQVGLRKQNTKVRETLPAELQRYLEKLDEGWFDWITDYRDALAHRIPLYIPPGGVVQRNVAAYSDLERRKADALNALKIEEYDRLSTEQDMLLIFQPLIAHSISETKGLYPFHVQLVADFLTIEELGEKMLVELRKSRE